MHILKENEKVARGVVYKKDRETRLLAPYRTGGFLFLAFEN